MPVTPTYPGVYIEELPSLVRTITGVPTSITAFVGRARRGPADAPKRITSWADYERHFGGLWAKSTMSYAVYHYYQNGGAEAIIVRLESGAAAATIEVGGGLTLEASSSGTWGNALRARVDYDNIADDDDEHYNLTIRDMDSGAQERFVSVSNDVDSSRSLERALESSSLVKAKSGMDKRPPEHEAVELGVDPFRQPEADGTYAPSKDDGSDGADLENSDYTESQADKTGIYQLLKTDIFNLLVIPPRTPEDDVGDSVLTAAGSLCADRRAMLIVDSRSGATLDNKAQRDAIASALGDNISNAALYFPRLRMPDPKDDGRLKTYVPSGAVAGIYARTDTQRGVWKAPAGTEAALNGARELTVKLTDLENGQLNPVGVNCLRSFPIIGNVVWGARTVEGADALGSQWKYVPVRRLALFIEESLYRGTQWVVFEPNDEPLWSQIRLNVGAFMNRLFRQGAFQGTSPRDAYFVKCDSETTPQSDIDLGIVNIVVGFAPLKPAEFVIIKIQQMAGQVEA